VNFILRWMWGAGARAWGAGWKDDLPRAIVVEITGLGVEPVDRAGSQRLAGAGEAWPGCNPGGDRSEKERVPGVGGCLKTGRPGTGGVGIWRPGPEVPLTNLCSL
jgi:hypothetical protein